MPSKKSYSTKKKRTYKKRTYKKKGAFGTTKPVYFKGALVPDRAIVKLKYFKRHSQANITTAPYNETFTITDLNDLNGGAQPRGRDEYAALYHRFKVIGIKWRAQVGTTTANGDSTTGVYVLSDSENAFTALRDIMEFRKSFGARTITNEKPTIMKGFIKPWFMENISKREWMTTDQYSGLFAGSVSPQFIPKIVFWGQSNDESSSVSIVWDITFTIYALLDIPQAVANS